MSGTKSSRLRYIDRPKVYSFAMFVTASAGGILILPGFFETFVVFLGLDSVGTYFGLESLISFDRFAYCTVLLVLSATVGSFTAPELILESLLVIMLMDISLFLRRIGESPQALKVISLRIRSYSNTLLIAYLLSFIVIIGYSFLNLSTSEPVLVLGLTSAGALALVYILVRYSIRLAPTSQ